MHEDFHAKIHIFCRLNYYIRIAIVLLGSDIYREAVMKAVNYMSVTE